MQTIKILEGLGILSLGILLVGIIVMFIIGRDDDIN